MMLYFDFFLSSASVATIVFSCYKQKWKLASFNLPTLCVHCWYICTADVVMWTLSCRFRDTYLSLGGGVHAGEVFRRFRGSDPTVDALIAYYTNTWWWICVTMTAVYAHCMFYV